MEVQFTKHPISCLKTVICQTQTQELTQEVRIPDNMPEVGRILGCWGQAMVRGKEWRGTGMSVSGGVMAWVLYAPEDGSAPCSVEAWIPFQMKWDFTENLPDGMICATASLAGLDGRSTSARKLMLRATVAVLGEAQQAIKPEIPYPENCPEDVALLKKTYPLDLPTESGEKLAQLDETLTVTGGAQIDKILSYSLFPEITEEKIMANRLVYRGKGLFHLLYADDNGQLHSWDAEVPFSQYADLESDHSSMATAAIFPVLTALEVDLTEDMHLMLKANVATQYTVYDQIMAEVLEDAYSPRRKVSLHMEKMELPVLLESRDMVITVQGILGEEAEKVVDMVSFADYPVVTAWEDGFKASVSGHCTVLYYDREGNLQSQTVRCEGEETLPSAEENTVKSYMRSVGKPQITYSGEGLTLMQPFTLQNHVLSGVPLSVADQLEAGEMEEADPNRPSLILCRVGEDGLWGLAKQCGSTVEAIQSANRLTDEPPMEKLLIVPVS